uniref:Uncharacterized protein n=1 Tax=Pithovirus LCPAC304 TaxID=2506594 RepID=A0A481Z8K4_9VIRU|nr:MAG: hypothetical protein LCPAC304_04640 [Pithovirus LCPAC304]
MVGEETIEKGVTGFLYAFKNTMKENAR